MSFSERKRGMLSHPPFRTYMATGATIFFALRFAALRTGFLAVFFAGFFAALRTVFLAALRTVLRAIFFAGFFAAFLTFLAIFISSSLLVVVRLLDGELFDSPCVFVVEFGLQVVSASSRANFSARLIFLRAMTARKLYEP